MKIGRNVAELQKDHVDYELECIDRMYLYLNLYIPGLQTPSFVAHFIKTHLGMKFASSAVLAPISEGFVKSIKEFCAQREVDLYRFKRGERKDDVAQEYLKAFLKEDGKDSEGILS